MPSAAPKPFDAMPVSFLSAAQGERYGRCAAKNHDEGLRTETCHTTLASSIPRRLLSVSNIFHDSGGFSMYKSGHEYQIGLDSARGGEISVDPAGAEVESSKSNRIAHGGAANPAPPEIQGGSFLPPGPHRGGSPA
jgi:hypothetical protein